MPASLTIPALLEEQAMRFGEREAVVAGASRLTHAELRREARHAARGLRALGVRRGDHVAILMGNRLEWMLAFFALQQLGATVVALNTWATPREMQYALAHSDVSCLVAVDRFRRNDYRAVLAEMRSAAGVLPHLRRTVWVAAGDDSQIATAADDEAFTWDEMLALGQDTPDGDLDAAAGELGPDDVAMLLYTSGSTAAPKGILLQHGHWIRNGFHIGERQKVTEHDRLWLAVSLFWSFGSVNAMANLFGHGGCIVLQEQFEPGEALALIERERCSILYATPNMVKALAEHPERAQRDLSSLRSGATIGTPEQVMAAMRLGAAYICNVYGLSETYGNCCVIDADEPQDVRLQSVGPPLPGVQLRICHLETGAAVAAGEVGEIRVQGPLFCAYYKDEEKTRDAFDADGFFRTGDLGQVDDQGRLYYRGRLKEMVKSGGINITPMEVEEVLMRHPAVLAAYVIGVPDAVLDEMLAAFIVARPGAVVSPAELAVFCKRELSAYKVPKLFRFVTEGELPLTTTGKLQKVRLKDLLQEGTSP